MDRIVIPNVPLDSRVPGVFFGIDGSRANQSLPGMPRRLMVLGDMSSAGSAALVTPIRILDAGQAPALFGAGSPLADMISAVRTHNNHTELWAMAGGGASGASGAELIIQISGDAMDSYGLPQKGAEWGFAFSFDVGLADPISVPVTYTASGSGNAVSGDFIAAAAAWATDLDTALGAYVDVSVVGNTITLSTTDVAAVGAWSVEYFVPMSASPVLHINSTAYHSGGSLANEAFEATTGGSGSAALGSIAVTVASPKAGVLSLYIAGKPVIVNVLSTDTATTLGSRIAVVINANYYLPVSASASVGVVTLTAKWAGVSGNAIDLRQNIYPDQVTASGVTVTLTAMAGGAGTPAIEPLLAAIGDEWFTGIVSAWSDGSTLSAIEAWLENRDGPMEPKAGHVFAAVNANLAGLISAGGARNSKQSTLAGCYGVPQPAYVWAAAIAAINEYEAALDPARPLQQVQIQLLPPAIPQRLTREERESLLASGISTFTVTPTGDVYTERLITTYQLSSLGIPDPTWLNLETVNTVEYIRYAVRTRIASKFPRMKLADDGTQFAAGQMIVTPSVIRGEMIVLFREFEEVGLVENFDQFKVDLQVERSQDRDRVNVIFPPDLINQLRITAGSVQFRL